MRRNVIAKATLVLLMGLFSGAVLSNGGGTGHNAVEGAVAQGATTVETRSYNNPSAYIGHAEDSTVAETRGYNNPSAYIGRAEDATVNPLAADDSAYEELRSAFGIDDDPAVLAETACPEPGLGTIAADSPSPTELMGLMLTEEVFADMNRPPMQTADEALAEAEDLNLALEPTAAGKAATTCK